MSKKKDLLGVEKSMSNEEYWKARAELKEKLLEKNTEKIEKEVLKIFKNARKEIINELKIIYSDIETTEYKKYETENLLKNLNKVIDNLYKENEKEITYFIIRGICLLLYFWCIEYDTCKRRTSG